MLGEVIDVDVSTRRVIVDTLGLRSAVGYDSMILAAGAQQSYFGHDRVRTRGARHEEHR